MRRGERGTARRSVAWVVGQRADHLDQLHQRHRVEEVQADEPVGPLGAGRQLGDAERRGVRGDQAVRADHRLDLRRRPALGRRGSRRSPRSRGRSPARSASVVVPDRSPSVLGLDLRGHLALGHAARRGTSRCGPAPSSSTSSLTSSTIVLNPAAADTCAMPAPISPHPTTPTVLIAMSPVSGSRLAPELTDPAPDVCDCRVSAA